MVGQWLEDQGFHIRDWGLLEATLERPWQQFEGVELYPDIWLKTAALLDSIESSHPLYDGNKRAGVLLASLMLSSQGIDDNLISDESWFNIVCDIASTHPSLDEIALMLRSSVDGQPTLRSNASDTRF
ncbi:Fic family protein [Corynebacterium aquatimens]|uniref:type II toxin-antitoxin system death-on-curing family toxin n=1 Tax=Corynebacterium sp. CNCTC7651 TaxID=2815361 RepID=UPI00351D6401|nr:Fic family protein [Corynebacterium aquatimens]UIZ93430.1 Fic family protein [Corynebacterium sp. CNCTC7651]